MNGYFLATDAWTWSGVTSAIWPTSLCGQLSVPQSFTLRPSSLIKTVLTTRKMTCTQTALVRWLFSVGRGHEGQALLYTHQPAALLPVTASMGRSARICP